MPGDFLVTIDQAKNLVNCSNLDKCYLTMYVLFCLNETCNMVETIYRGTWHGCAKWMQ